MPNECPECKKPITRDGRRFCNYCGADLRPLEPVSAQMAFKEDPATVTSPTNPTTNIESNIDQKGAKPVGPSLRILTREGQVLERPIERDETTIGKAPMNDILLADPA